jgi:hypothetical protein
MNSNNSSSNSVQPSIMNTRTVASAASSTVPAMSSGATIITNETTHHSSSNHSGTKESFAISTSTVTNGVGDIGNRNVLTSERVVSISEKATRNIPQPHPHFMAARTEFCQYDVLACINCSNSSSNSLDTDVVVTPPSSLLATTNTTMSRKLGPLLLDLRRLNFSNTTIDHNNSNDHDHAATTPSLFSTTVIAQSRGNPSLGSSIYSTCLTVPSNINDDSSASLPPLIATGLSTGALCIHSFTAASDHIGTDSYQSSIEYYQIPRNNRPATSVAWRPNHVSHVAIGYANSTSGGGSSGVTASSGATTNSFSFASNAPEPMPMRRPLQQAGVNMGGTTTGGGLSANPSTVVDRQYCCFLWDVEHQAPSTMDEVTTTTSSPPIRRTKATPLYKLSHNQGVLCLSWILDEGGGQILAVGGQQRNIQLYDLRISGSSSTPAVQPSPVSVFGHTSGVHGIESDPNRPWHFCSYASTVGEVVKIWDVRRIDSPLSEIKPVGTKNTTSTITSAKWSTLSPGHLSVLVGETTLSTYDTFSNVSRPIFTSTAGANKTIMGFTHYPYSNLQSHDDYRSITVDDKSFQKKRVMLELFPKQIVAVCSDQTVNVVSCHRIAPLAVSPRNGQIVHAIGQSLLLGSATEGPAAMERFEMQSHHDISAIILRRAQGSAIGKYSMDIASNIEILTEESLKFNETSSTSSVEQLLRLWKWIQLAEVFCQEDTPNWPAKSLIDAGVAKLLVSDRGGTQENQSFSDSLGCFTFDSPGRRYVWKMIKFMWNYSAQISNCFVSFPAFVQSRFGNLWLGRDV